jgi:hypothetical protein
MEKRLGEMPPSLSPSNVHDGALIHTVGSCESASCFIGGSNSQDLDFGQLGEGVSFSALQAFGMELTPMSAAPRLPALRDRVGIVVADCSKEKVDRVAARRVVAPMQDAKPRWYGPPYQGPCDSVGFGSSRWRRGEATVTESFAVCHPWPARVRTATLVYVGPESIGDGWEGCPPRAQARAEAPVSMCDRPLSCHERSMTVLAGTGYRIRGSHSHLHVRVVRDRSEVHASPGPVHFSTGAAQC